MSTDSILQLSNHHQTQNRTVRMSAADEQQWIEQARQGNEEAFRCLVQRYMKQAYNIAYGFLGSHDIAEDVAQEAFVRVYQGLDSFRGEAAFSTWLYRIVMNLSINNRKSLQRTRQRMLSTDEAQGAAHPDQGHNNGELRAHLERALHELPTLQRAVVLLRHFEGLSTKQVSSILGCSEGTVKTHLFRGLKKLRRALDHLRTEIV